MISREIGCTSYTARQTAELARHARSVGADGVLSTPPPYAHPNPEELVQFYRDISDAVDIPIMVYNWPRGVAVEIQTETVLRLAEVANVVAIKNSTAALKNDRMRNSTECTGLRELTTRAAEASRMIEQT